jgi:hypothetical protein
MYNIVVSAVTTLLSDPDVTDGSDHTAIVTQVRINTGEGVNAESLYYCIDCAIDHGQLLKATYAGGIQYFTLPGHVEDRARPTVAPSTNTTLIGKPCKHCKQKRTKGQLWHIHFETCPQKMNP